MEPLQACPCCLSEVDIVSVDRSSRIEQKYYFFIHCHHCGKGTPNAYASKNVLVALWNSMVLENKSFCVE